jgi:hypothetical protein
LGDLNFLNIDIVIYGSGNGNTSPDREYDLIEDAGGSPKISR